MILHERSAGLLLCVLSLVTLAACDAPQADKDSVVVDSDAVDPETLDGDGDGYSPAAGDCDDANRDVSPAALEVCEDGVDEDCDGADPFCDSDGDGYTSDVDCDDSSERVHPGADEVCNNVDDNCVNGQDDEECEHDDECDCGVGDGYFVAGEYSSDWDCLNYYSAAGEEITSELLCDGCDFSVLLYAEYQEGAVPSVPECDWASLESWGEITAFYSIWGMSYEPEGYPYPLVYYYAYGEGSGWVPWSSLYYGDSERYGGYLSWRFWDEIDSTGAREVGLFFLYTYSY